MVNQSRTFRLHPARISRQRSSVAAIGRSIIGNGLRDCRPACHPPWMTVTKTAGSGFYIGQLARRVAALERGHKKPGICRAIDPLLTGVVGGTGFEPVTPTMSR